MFYTIPYLFSVADSKRYFHVVPGFLFRRHLVVHSRSATCSALRQPVEPLDQMTNRCQCRSALHWRKSWRSRMSRSCTVKWLSQEEPVCLLTIVHLYLANQQPALEKLLLTFQFAYRASPRSPGTTSFLLVSFLTRSVIIIITFDNEGGYVFRSVCLSVWLLVCLSARLLKSSKEILLIFGGTAPKWLDFCGDPRNDHDWILEFLIFHSVLWYL